MQYEFDNTRPRDVCFVLPTYYLRGNLTLMDLFDISNFRGFHPVFYLPPRFSIPGISRLATKAQERGIPPSGIGV